MVHLPGFGHRLKSQRNIKLLKPIQYDNQGFDGFFKRVGFTDNELWTGLVGGNISFLQHEPHIYASLLQSWCYWGLLHACLGKPVQVDDFVEPKTQILTTQHLERDLVQWAQRLQMMDLDLAKEHVKMSHDALLTVSSLLWELAKRNEEVMNSTDDQDKRHRRAHGEEVPNETVVQEKQYWRAHGAEVLPNNLHISISILGYSLGFANKAIVPAALLDVLREEGFCKSDLRLFKGAYGFEIALLAMAFPGLNREGDHSRCTDDRCESNSINRDDHPRKHIKDGCVCEDFLPESERNKIFDVIKRGGVPLVRVNSAASGINGHLDLEIMEAEPYTSYVAFSHVWVHGRGNGKGNSIYKCQWLWLQDCAQEGARKLEEDMNIPRTSAEQIVPFWIDTICLPKGDQSESLRPGPVSMMPEIYRNAELVMVLDNSLESAENTDLFESTLRLKFCSWSRRAWPLYEGAVAKKVLFRMADCVVDLTVRADHKRQCTVREGDQWHIVQAIETNFEYALMPLCIMVTKWAESTRDHFWILWRELKHRATSVPNDRYLILGSVCQLDKTLLVDLQKIPLDESDAAQTEKTKMLSLLSSIQLVPQGIIFTSSKRFNDLGLKWCPASIGHEIPFRKYLQEEGQLRYIRGKGLLVDYKVFHLEDSIRNILPSMIWFVKLGQEKFRLTDEWSLEGHGKLTELSSVSPNSKLSIIVSALPDSKNPTIHYSRAILVEELGSLEIEPPYTAQPSVAIQANFIALLEIEDALDIEEVRGPEIGCFWVNNGAEQLWCVG